MTHYIELTLIDNKDLGQYALWSKLYTQLHLALVEQKDATEQVPYGVSFPRYTIRPSRKSATGIFASLGDKLRVFAPTVQHLQQLDLPRWLARLNDYVHMSSIKTVPQQVDGYVNVRRYRPKFDPEKVAARFAAHQLSKHARHLTPTQALEYCTAHKRKALNLPYIRLRSLTTQHTFDLFIEQRSMTTSQSGGFSTYGFSQNSTVPLF